MGQLFYTIMPGASVPEGGAPEIGNKGWNLARMAATGLPVPPAFVLPTNWCLRRRGGEADDPALHEVLREGIGQLESTTGLTFGSARRPLLVSVRSGAAVSMPGMMETVLDVGLNATTVEGLVRLTGNPRLAWDSYRRLIQGYGEVVLGLPAAPFEALTQAALADAEVESERELDHRALRALALAMLERFRMLTGTPFPQDPFEQLHAAAAAVFRSWDAEKAATYRRLNDISDDLGTAVVVQTMVYGNAGGASGAGVGFTRNPATGERELYFDFVFNGQGEDVVAGRQELPEAERLRQRLPQVFTELERVAHALEQLYGDAQDFEFTLQSGRLYLLQTRRAKRTPWAALRIAVDMVEEGLITPVKALSRLSGIDLASVGRTRFAAAGMPVAHARVAGMGVASGAIALDGTASERMAEAGASVILVRRETSTSDVAAMARADGILTASGGRTSHAAVVARQLGKVCLVGCADLRIDLDRRTCSLGGQEFAEGDFLSLDGNQGAIYAGRLEAVIDRPARELHAIAEWRRNAV